MFTWLSHVVSRPHKSRSRKACQKRRARFETLEERSMLSTVHLTVDPLQNATPISPFIYGANQSLDDATNLAFTRAGGNRWTAYNWENNASNAGSDYFFQNDAYLGGGNTPGGAVIPLIQNAAARDAGILLTVPINGYVAADKNGGGDVRNSGANYLQTRFRQEVARKGSALSLTPNTTDAYVYQDEFVNWVNTNYPYGQTDPDRPIWFSLDNEPDLWASTHAEVHPNATTYAELVAKTIDYANAIKSVAPGAKVFGPANYGWYGYITLQDAPDRAGRDFQEFYLQQLKQAETTYGQRLVDVLDVHWYPEAQGGGFRITGQETTPEVVAARLQAPRSLWDPTYTETSWITQWSTGGPIKLLPRLADKIDRNYAGTKLAITEYNYGGGSHISGGIAQADVLGIFGRDGVFAANQWPLAGSEPFVAAAFKMYRNFDGAGGTFGDTSILANTDNVADTSVYASIDPANPNVMTLVVINKTSQPISSIMQLAQVAPGATADVYQLTGASANPQFAGRVTIGDPSNFNYSLPAYSVSTLRIVSSGSANAAPTVAIAASASPSPTSGTTTNLSVLGDDEAGEANLKYTWSTTGTPPAAVVFSANGTNAAKSVVATFSRAGTYNFQVIISDGTLSTTSSVSVLVNQQLTSITLNPPSATIATGANQQFTATARDQFGVALASQPAVTWSIVSGGGIITQAGLYSAPSTAGMATIRVTSGGVSGTANVTITASPPAAPSNLSAKSVSSSRIDLSWLDRSSNELGFLIERSTNGLNWTTIGSVGSNVSTYSATGLAASTTYYFRVRAYNNSGYSAYSGIVNAHTKRRSSGPLQ